MVILWLVGGSNDNIGQDAAIGDQKTFLVAQYHWFVGKGNEKLKQNRLIVWRICHRSKLPGKDLYGQNQVWIFKTNKSLHKYEKTYFTWFYTGG